jgi:hypothetical protein
MTAYPNREHENADNAARRRALAALRDIAEDAENLRGRIERGYEPHGTDADRFTAKSVKLALNLSVMETLRDVREWHAADVAEVGPPAPGATVVGIAVWDAVTGQGSPALKIAPGAITLTTEDWGDES